MRPSKPRKEIKVLKEFSMRLRKSFFWKTAIRRFPPRDAISGRILRHCPLDCPSWFSVILDISRWCLSFDCLITRVSRLRWKTPKTHRRSSRHWQGSAEECTRSGARLSDPSALEPSSSQLPRLPSAVHAWYQLDPPVVEGSHRGVAWVEHPRRDAPLQRPASTGRLTPPGRTGWSHRGIGQRSYSPAWVWVSWRRVACEDDAPSTQGCLPFPTLPRSHLRPAVQSPSDPSARPSNDWYGHVACAPASASSPCGIDKCVTLVPRTPCRWPACNPCAVTWSHFILSLVTKQGITESSESGFFCGCLASWFRTESPIKNLEESVVLSC